MLVATFASSHPFFFPSQEMLTHFQEQFVIAYGLAIVQKVKDEIEPEADWTADLQLLVPPVPSKPIQEGKMRKVRENNFSHEHVTQYKVGVL